MTDKEKLLTEALSNLLDRIISTPTMSGHLTDMRFKPDHGDQHKTSNAIGAAKLALTQEPQEEESAYSKNLSTCHQYGLCADKSMEMGGWHSPCTICPRKSR